MSATSSGPTACGLPSADAPAPPAPPRDPWADTRFAELFGVDLRSLAVFRIGIALVVLFDLASRALDLHAQYTDVGVLPRSALLNDFGHQFYISLHLASGEAIIQGLLFLFAAFVALALLVGYRSRTAAVLTWLLLVSLQNRNPVVLQGGDVLLRVLMFWAMFLPLGARFSVDAALDTGPGLYAKRFLSVGSAALLLQMCIVYWFGAALKYHPANPVWLRGDAVRYALEIDIYATSLGVWLRQFPAFLRPLTWVTLAVEVLGPLLVFCPVWTWRVRTAAIVVLILMHVGFGLFLTLGLFPFVSIVGWLVFVPSQVWDRLLARLRTPERGSLRIYYDGECGFCRIMVLLIRTFLLLPETPLRPAQEDEAIDREMRERNSWVVIDHLGRHHHKFEAMQVVFRASPIAWPLAPLLGWGPVRRLGTRLYELVADNRSAAGHAIRFLRPRAIDNRRTFWGGVLAALLFIYVLAWNVRELNFGRFHPWYPSTFNMIARTLRIDQFWSMFAPYPLTEDGWFVAEGRLRDGTRIDVHTGEAATFDKPRLVSRTYRNQRWRKYLENVASGAYESQWGHYGGYLCRDWNARHEGAEALTDVRLYFVVERTLPEGVAEPTPVLRWRHWCFAAPAEAAEVTPPSPAEPAPRGPP